MLYDVGIVSIYVFIFPIKKIDVLFKQLYIFFLVLLRDPLRQLDEFEISLSSNVAFFRVVIFREDNWFYRNIISIKKFLQGHQSFRNKNIFELKQFIPYHVFSKLRGHLNLFFSHGLNILFIIQVYMDVRKFLYDFHELFDLLVILKHLPLLNVIRDERFVPHLNLISHFMDNMGFKGTSFYF
jgi:hypothetical protein